MGVRGDGGQGVVWVGVVRVMGYGVVGSGGGGWVGVRG